MANEKIEITDAMIADAKVCGKHPCGDCKIFQAHGKKITICAAVLAAALEAERAKGPGVWTDAPEDADSAYIVWYEGFKKLGMNEYKRGLPKTPSRLRAESIIGPKGEKLDGDEWDRAVAAVERELG